MSEDEMAHELLTSWEQIREFIISLADRMFDERPIEERQKWFFAMIATRLPIGWILNEAIIIPENRGCKIIVTPLNGIPQSFGMGEIR